MTMTRRRRRRLARTVLTAAALLALATAFLTRGSNALVERIVHRQPAAQPAFANHLLVEGIHGFSAAEVHLIGHAVAQSPLTVAVGELYVQHGRPPFDALPLATIGADPSAYADAAGVRRLRTALSDGVVVSTSAAALLDLRLGQELRVVHGRPLRVTAVLADDLLSGYQLLVRPTAEPTLAPRADYVVVRGSSSQDSTLESTIRTALPSRRLRFTRAGEFRYFSPSGDVLSQSQVSARFGAFAVEQDGTGLVPDPAWVRSSIVDVSVPLLGHVSCHREIVAALVAAMTELQREGLGAAVDRQDFQREGGCWNPRAARSDHGVLSHHAWGIAIDINVARNPLGARPDQDPRLVAAMEQHGFTWGGRWLRHDGAHFEWLGNSR